MTFEGVGEASSLADALCFFDIGCGVRACFKVFDACQFDADLRRLLQALQYFGQVAPFSTLPAAFASFHSTPHFFCRSRAASIPALGSFFGFAFLSGALACCCATAVDMSCGIGAITSPRASAAANITLYMTSLSSMASKGAGVVSRRFATARNLHMHRNSHRLYALSCECMRSGGLRIEVAGPRSKLLFTKSIGNGARHGAWKSETAGL